MKSRSVSAGICRWYHAAQRCGKFTLYSLVDDIRAFTGRVVTDGTVTRKMRQLRKQRLLDYRVVDAERGQYEWQEVAA